MLIQCSIHVPHVPHGPRRSYMLNVLRPADRGRVVADDGVHALPEPPPPGGLDRAALPHGHGRSAPPAPPFGSPRSLIPHASGFQNAAPSLCAASITKSANLCVLLSCVCVCVCDCARDQPPRGITRNHFSVSPCFPQRSMRRAVAVRLHAPHRQAAGGPRAVPRAPRLPGRPPPRPPLLLAAAPQPLRPPRPPRVPHVPKGPPGRPLSPWSSCSCCRRCV